jgi:5-methylcytosine-specific restriction endonuclease McrA
LTYLLHGVIIIKRKDALNSGLVRYFTGKKCPNGHTSERYTKTGNCCECLLLNANKWRANNPHKVKLYSKKYHVDNRDDRNLKSRLWHSSNKDKHKQLNKEWHEKNKTSRVIHEAKRRALKKSIGGSFTKKDINLILYKQKNQCVYCNVNISTGFHIDHIKPISKGGDNSKENIQVLCKRCNLSKYNKDHNQFLTDRKKIK